MKHSEILADFRGIFPAGVVKEIDEEIVRWNQDPSSKKNLFSDVPHGNDDHKCKQISTFTTFIGTSLLKMRKELAECERFEIARESMRSESGISASHWLTVGIELEDSK